MRECIEAVLAGFSFFGLMTGSLNYLDRVRFEQKVQTLLRLGQKPSEFRRVFCESLIGLILGFMLGVACEGRLSAKSASFGLLFCPVPLLYRWERRRKRKWQIFRSFPDFLDLLALALSSGLNLERGWQLAARSLSAGPLKVLLQEAQTHIQRGQPRQEVLRQLSQRLSDSRLSGPLAVIRQSMKIGSALEDTLLDQAKSLRELAALAIERRAQTASLRLLFPLLFFIFPTLFIVLFGPLLIEISRNGGLF